MSLYQRPKWPFWENDKEPAINAENLNYIEAGLMQCSADSVASMRLEHSSDSFVVTITGQGGLDLATASLDIVSWLSQSTFYTQTYINSCFPREVIIEEN